ncbi:hypothetical protein ACIQRS_03435 [Streptomyces termitum]|uniref:Uncharacterized protein n=1 Tax=Streptomyces termitum TaxID=67368 RepID=A0A918WD40_9ACTN|nr:hypothetical protein [Streptomyces termitum]GHB10736.1 hypothetical protein GCM10010305_61890 [Streptomyces termitum]
MRYDEKEEAVRRLLDTAHPPVPGDLGRRAAARGARLGRRGRLLRRTLRALCALAVLWFTLWAADARPWEPPPAATTPPFDGP